MREEYRERTIFENGEEGSGDYSLESVVRSAAQRMIQGALEAEVTEFLGRLPGEKSERAEGFHNLSGMYRTSENCDSFPQMGRDPIGRGIPFHLPTQER